MKNPNKNIKAFFIDLDGTALDTKKNGGPWISEDNMRAIAKTRHEGKHVIVSTGRIDGSVFSIFKKIGGDYIVLGNGAQVLNKNLKKLVNIKINIRNVAVIVDFVQKHKLSIRLSGDPYAYGIGSYLNTKISQRLGFQVKSGYTFDMQIPRNKIIIWGNKSKKSVQRTAKKIKKILPKLEIVTSGHGWTIEITGAGATKGKGNEFVWKKLKLIKEETVHIGDTMNDSTTINHVGRLIAMKNSDKELKEIASHIGPHYKNGGVSKVLDGEYTRARIKR